jgi:hypothetical protein
VERVVSEVYQVNFGHVDMGHKKGALRCRDKLATIYHLEYVASPSLCSTLQISNHIQSFTGRSRISLGSPALRERAVFGSLHLP